MWLVLILGGRVTTLWALELSAAAQAITLTAAQLQDNWVSRNVTKTISHRIGSSQCTVVLRDVTSTMAAALLWICTIEPVPEDT